MYDPFGLPLSTMSAEAVTAFNEGLHRLLYQQSGAEGFFTEALSVDPGFAMAHLGRALAYRNAARIADSNAAITLAREQVASVREAGLIDALSVMFSGQPDRADEALADHLTVWPTDAIALFVRGTILNLFSSRTDRDREMLRAIEASLPAYEGHPYVLGAYAFALEENRRFDEAHSIARDAVRALPNNARAAHAFAHTALETGQSHDGEQFLSTWLESWEHPGPFACHLSWHQAISALTREDRAAAATGLRSILGFKGVSIAVLTDAASLGWRCLLDGDDPNWLWEELASIPDVIGNRFSNAHRAMVLAATEDFTALARYIEALRTAGGLNVYTASWSEALLLYRKGHMAAAAGALDRLVPHVRLLGGSQAQTDVFRETFISALEQSGRRAEARIELERRLRQRSCERDERWLQRVSG